MDKIVVDGEHLTVEDVYSVANGKKGVTLPNDNKFWKVIEEARSFLLSYIKTGRPAYGVTTNFGDSCNNQISIDKADELQRVIVHYHGIGLGEPFCLEVGRAVILCRLNSNCKQGFSAVRPALLKFMENLLEHDIIPVIPQLGSVGASGDLTPLSYLAAVIMGERKVYYKGAIVKTSEAFSKEGITPLPLMAKEGLALMNGTSVMTAVAALCVKDCERLTRISDLITAGTVEVMRGKDTPFLEVTNRIKNHKGQTESAAYIYGIIKSSKRLYKYEEFLNEKIEKLGTSQYKRQNSKIQDRYSIRCAPQINGVARDTVTIAKEWITEELNSVNDNPLVDLKGEQFLNTGNFYGGHICASCDYLRVALANISDLSDKQAEIIIDGKFNNLTENLIPFTPDTHKQAGLRLGFKGAQITISAIRGEIQGLSNPISVTSSPTEAVNQDKVSMGTISARKLKEAVDLLYLQYATHLLALIQAVDLCVMQDKIAKYIERHIDKSNKDGGNIKSFCDIDCDALDNLWQETSPNALFSPTLCKVYKEVRAISAKVTEDRVLDNEAEEVAKYLKSGITV